MLRTPLLPISKLYKEISEQRLQELLCSYADDKFVHEAITMASPSLAAKLPTLTGELSDRKLRQVVASFQRYLLRMASRPTPFGLFTGVAVGRWGEKTDVRVDALLPLKKRTRPDMLWLLSIIQRIEQRFDVVKGLNVQWNQLAYRKGNFFELAYLTEYGLLRLQKGVKRKKVTLAASEAVLRVRDLASQPIRVEQLAERLHLELPNHTIQEVQQFLQQLLRSELLLSELRPPLTADHPFEWVLSRLEPLSGVEQEMRLLREIAAAIRRYDEQPAGMGHQAYLDTVALMNQLFPIEAPLQTDVMFQGGTPQLFTQVAEEGVRAADCLLRLSLLSQSSPSVLEAYHARFLERYGTACEVPLMECLHEEAGLGPLERNAREGQSALSNHLLEMLLQCVRKGEREIVLTEEWLERVGAADVDLEQASDTFELYLEVVADSSEEIDRGNYQLVIGSNYGSQRAGQAVGRFLDMFDEETVEPIREMDRLESALRPDVTYVDVTYLPTDGRIANVALVPQLLEHELALGTHSSGQADAITLEDLVVGATPERLYIKSWKLGREVVFTTRHLIGSSYLPDVVYFLRTVSQGGTRPVRPFDWGALEDSPYLPSVRYGKTVLSPRRWRLSLALLKLGELPRDQDVWQDVVAAWREEWHVPRYVYVARYEKRILLDLNQPRHVEELREGLKQFDKLDVYEKVGSLDTHWVRGTDGYHVAEFVLPMIRKERPARAALPQMATKRIDAQAERLRLPGSDWLYIKLYGTRNQEEMILNATAFAESMVQKRAAEQYYYVRYLDEQPHLRLRFHGNPQTLTNRLLPELHRWAEKAIDNGTLQRLVIDTYERELERYGGPELIASAERYFSGDSRTTAKMLSMTQKRQVKLPMVVQAGLSILDLLAGFGLDEDDQLHWLEQRVDKQEFLQEMRPWRSLLLALLRSEGSNHALRDAFGMRSEALAAYAEGVRSRQQAGTLTNHPDKILAGLVHMHCNRLLGINPVLERKARSFARYALYQHRIHRLEVYP